MNKVFNYIVMFFMFCNIFTYNIAYAEELNSSNNQNQYYVKDDTNRFVDDTPESILPIENKFAKFVFIPFLLDNMYPDEEINEDFTDFLQKVYPASDEDSLYSMQNTFRYMIAIKRRYVYVVDALKKQIKAEEMLPKDALIVAKEDEFTKFDPYREKNAKDGEYVVSNSIDKYIDYDHGELGIPIKRRDKNYQEITVASNKLLLALLQFDIPAFYKELAKIPNYNDGTAEKPNEFDNGVKTRLLFDTAKPADYAKIKGVIEVYVPDNLYLNADFNDKNIQPKFILNEDKVENIKNFKIYYPLVNAVQNDNITKPILVNHITFPIEFERVDTLLDTNLNGSFSFQVCDVDENCTNMQSNNYLILKPNFKYEKSIHANYINKAFAQLPKNEDDKLQIQNAVYDKNQEKFTVTFKTKKKHNNVIVLAENSSGVNFYNPTYKIDDDTITAQFDVNNPQNKLEVGDVVISAIFDNVHNYRAETKLDIKFNDSSKQPNDFILFAFILGIFVIFLPGVFHNILNLIILLLNEKNKKKVFGGFAITLLTLLFGIFSCYKNSFYGKIYFNPLLLCISVLLIVSQLMENLRYMDFNLFRPFRAFINKGVFQAFACVVLLFNFPIYIKNDLFEFISYTNDYNFVITILAFYSGMLIFPFLTMFIKSKFTLIFVLLKKFNIIFNTIYLVVLFWLVYVAYGVWAFCVMSALVILIMAIWYVYPLILEEAIKGIDDERRKFAIFKNMQRIFFYIIMTVLTLSCVSLYLFKIKEIKNPSIKTVQEFVQKSLDINKPVLVIVATDFSFDYVKNKIKIYNMLRKSNHIIEIKYLDDDEDVLAWQNKFNSTKKVFSILFNNQHPNGLMFYDNMLAK